MGTFDIAGSAAFTRAAERARLVLKPGDRVRVDNSTVTFVGWVGAWGVPDPNGRYFASKSSDEWSPWNVTKVNGQLVSFRDDEGERAVASNVLRFAEERRYEAAIVVQQRRQSIRLCRPSTPFAG